MSSRRSGGGIGCGIAGVGCIVLAGFLGFAGILTCSGAGTAIWNSLPEVVEVAPPRPVAGTPGSDPVEPDPEPVAPPSRPGPRPAPRPGGTRPSPTSSPSPSPEPEPVTVEVESDELVVAEVSVSGDASAVVAISPDGTAYPLPGTIQRGTYDIQVTFDDREPFVAGSLAILDGTPKSVTCKKSLGICRVQ